MWDRTPLPEPFPVEWKEWGKHYEFCPVCHNDVPKYAGLPLHMREGHGPLCG